MGIVAATRRASVPGAPNSLGQEDPRGRKPMACRDWLEALEFAECGELLVSLVPLDDRELK